MVFKKEKNRNIEKILILEFLGKYKTLKITVKIDINILCFGRVSKIKVLIIMLTIKSEKVT